MKFVNMQREMKSVRSVTIVLMLIIWTFELVVSSPVTDYMTMRADMIDKDEKNRIGSDLVLTEAELVANKIFMKEKRAMIEGSRVNRSLFIPSTSFYSSKPYIDNTYLFQLIHRMPKGAVLHTHDQSMVSLDWIIKNVTYRDHVYMCLWQQSYLIFRVFQNGAETTDCDWKLVSKERDMSKDAAAFDQNLRKNLSLVDTDPFVAYQDNQIAWDRFSRFFKQVGQLLYYVPIFRDMLWQTMEEFNEANVQYIEARLTYNGLYDLEGKQYTREHSVQMVKEVNDAFAKVHPDFFGMKIIFCGIRFQNMSVVLDEIKEVMTLHQKYPDVVAGYDLGGNEAFYNPLSYYSEALLYPSQQNPPYHLPYFLHAGETIWQGTETGYNMVDALLLNATRVGHAYALSKHPYLMKLYKEKNIPIEVQPLSNQVLRLVSDFRNHPMASLIADNYSIVIGCDDRTSIDSAPLSHDFFLVFTAMSSDQADLTLLKQLAINSIRFSTLDEVRKKNVLEVWQRKWDTFISEVPRLTPITPLTTSSSTLKGHSNASPALTWSFSWTVVVFLVVYHRLCSIIMCCMA